MKKETTKKAPAQLKRKNKLSAEKIDLQPGQGLSPVKFRGFINVEHVDTTTGQESIQPMAVFIQKDGSPVWVTKNRGLAVSLMLTKPEQNIEVLRLPDEELQNGNKAARYDVFELA